MSGIIKKIFKLFAYLLLVMVIFTVSVMGVFIATFDANEYKQDLTGLLREQTGRDLQFYGDVGLTFYPALGMKLGALSLSNAKGFGNQPMVKVNQVSISVDVASLIAFSPEVEQLLLADLDILLQRNAAGVTNWDDLVKPGDANTRSETSPSESVSEDSAMTVKGAFGGLNIQNARLLWQDKQAGVEYRVSDLDLKTGRMTPDAPFPLQLHVAVQSSGEIDASLDLTSRVQYLFGSGHLKLDSFDLNMTANGSLVPLAPLNAGLAVEQVLVDPQARSIDLQSLVLTLNNLQLNGDVKVTDYAQPAVSFKLAADTLDIDELLAIPPPSEQPEPAVETEPVRTGSAEDVEIKLPMELLRSVEIDGSLTIAKLKLKNLWMEQMNLGLNAKKGIVDLKPLKMALYEGRFDGAIQIDARGDVPKYKITKNLTNVQVGDLLTDFSGEDRISGNMTAGVSIATRGEWLSELKKNSNGNMSLKFSDGALKGFNLRYLLEKAKAKLRGKSPPDESTRKTDFSALSLTGRIRNGVFSSNDLNLQAPTLRVSGKGKADLNNDTVDFLVNAKLVGTLKGQQAGSQDELRGLLIPVRIVGPFTAPDIDVQLDEMLKAQGNAKIAAEKARLKEKIEQEKAALEKQIAEQKAALETAKQDEIEKQKAVLEARKKAAEEKAKKKIEDKLKNLFD